MLLFALLSALVVCITFRSIQADYRFAKQVNLEMDREFISTLETYRVTSYEVISETVRRATDQRHPCQVYRIIFDDKGQFYLYMYYPGQRGMPKQLTKERALLAARTKGQVRA